jgi:hypothetical protein
LISILMMWCDGHDTKLDEPCVDTHRASHQARPSTYTTTLWQRHNTLTNNIELTQRSHARKHCSNWPTFYVKKSLQYPSHECTILQ